LISHRLQRLLLGNFSLRTRSSPSKRKLASAGDIRPVEFRPAFRGGRVYPVPGFSHFREWLVHRSGPKAAKSIAMGSDVTPLRYIRHDALLAQRPYGPSHLRKWLEIRVTWINTSSTNDDGTPQGGIILQRSPLCVDWLRSSEGKVPSSNSFEVCEKSTSSVNFIRYADDFVINR